MAMQDNNFGHPGDRPTNSPASRAALPATVASAQPPAVDWPMAEMGYQELPQANSVTLGGFLTAMRRHGIRAIGFGILASAIVCGILLVVIPIEYKAEAYFTIDRETPSLLPGRNDRQMSDPAYELFRSTQKALIKSPIVVQAALRTKGISSLPIVQYEGGANLELAEAWLTDEIKVAFPSDSSLMQISLYGDDKDDTITLLQAVYDAYNNIAIQQKSEKSANDLSTLRKELRQTTNELAKESAKFELHSQEQGAKTSEGAQIEIAITQEKLSYDRRDLANIKNELRQIDAEGSNLIIAMEPGDMVFNEFEIEARMEQFPDYADALFQFKHFRDQHEAARSTASPGSIMVSRARGDMQAAKAKLDRVKREYTPRVQYEIQSQTTLPESAAKKALKSLQVRKAQLTNEIAELTLDIDKRDKELMERVLISGDLKTTEANIESLSAQITEMNAAIARIEIDKGKTDQIKAISKAQVKDQSSWVLKTLEIVAAGMATMGMIIFAFTVYDVRARRVNELDDVSFQAGVPVIGSLPALDGSGSVLGIGALKGNLLEGALNDSIDSIRTALLHNKKTGNLSVVMVTSAGGQEGKSTIASQLATSLGRSGRRTLLIDGDIRNPQQHHVFGMSGNTGLCEVLRGQVSPADATQATQVDGLWAMFGGRCNHQSLRALSTDALPSLMNELRSQYDFIVIDAGPVLTGAEPMLIGQYADAALLSVRRDVSQLPKVHAANERLESVGIYVMGAIVNGTASEIRNETMEPMDTQEAITA